MKDKYFITWDDGYGLTTTKCNTRGEAEVAVDNILKDGKEMVNIILGRHMTWTVHTEISLSEVEEEETKPRFQGGMLKEE